MREGAAMPQVMPKIAKKPTNISLPVDVYEEAKELGINISKVCEQFLRNTIREEKERLWNEQNAEFITAYNRKVEIEGVALQEWRAF
jgi:antitoxin CcdA